MAADPYRYFRIEGREILEQLEKGLFELEKGAPSAGVVQKMLRLAHTLKGAARVVKQHRIADLAHMLEDLLVPVRDEAAELAPGMLESALGHVDAMRAELLTLASVVTDGARKSEPARAPEAALSDAKTDIPGIDGLLNGLSELGLKLGDLDRSQEALRRAQDLAQLVCDQLSVRRTLQTGESGRIKLRSLADELATTLAGVERSLTLGVEQAGRELEQVRQDAERLRLVAADTMWSALERTVRDGAHSVGKRVRLVTLGGDIRLDAELLLLVNRALVQTVRNAIAHGIEAPAERIRLGKPLESLLSIEVRRRGSVVEFSCQDDGRGLDIVAVRQSAERRGLRASELSELDAEGLFRLLLRGGISTQSSVTALAGRGVGLDVVREAAEALGAEIGFQSTEGLGTTIRIAVPVKQSGLSALLAKVADLVVAIPLSAVRGTSRRTGTEIRRAPDGDAIELDGKLVPYLALTRALGIPDSNDGLGVCTAVLVKAETGLVALGVERLLGTENIVARTLPELVLMPPVVSGAALDRDGNPRLVLSPEWLVRRAASGELAPRVQNRRARPILVIDDSLTTRMLEQSILESAGYEVELASSAEEGLEKATARSYGLFLVDVEMPGMDGFAFIKTARADPALAEIPAILVTSRASEQDLERGLAVGARAHIVKSKFEQGALLERIRALVIHDA